MISLQCVLQKGHQPGFECDLSLFVNSEFLPILCSTYITKFGAFLPVPGMVYPKDGHLANALFTETYFMALKQESLIL